MSNPHTSRTPSRLTIAAIALEVFLAIGALGGGLALMLGPRGETLPLPVALLSGAPFDSYFVPGLTLFGLLGVGPLVVAVLAWRGQRWAPLLTTGVGGTLLTWLVVQIAMVGYSNEPPFQPIYLALGAVISAVGIASLRRAGLASRTGHPATG